MKSLVFSLVILFYTHAAMACDTDSVSRRDSILYLDNSPTEGVVIESNTQSTRYDRRVHRRRQNWGELIPTQLVMQYAGNMGLMSWGIGWDYGKHNQWETDLLFGYLPKYDSDRSKITMTLKQNYIPWNITLGEGPISFEPLTCGLYFNTVFGDEFWVSEPDRYPSGYYGFSSKIRTHIFLGQRVTFDIPRKKRFMAKSITLFYELSSCDLYIISAFTNSYLRMHDYLSLSFGLRMQLL